jgi:hypothetical protein
MLLLLKLKDIQRIFSRKHVLFSAATYIIIKITSNSNDRRYNGLADWCSWRDAQSAIDIMTTELQNLFHCVTTAVALDDGTYVNAWI